MQDKYTRGDDLAVSISVTQDPNRWSVPKVSHKWLAGVSERKPTPRWAEIASAE